MNKKKNTEIDFNSQFNQQEKIYISDFSTYATCAELFVCAPTGVKFSGHNGAYPEVEGYFISLRLKDGSNETEDEWYKIRTKGEFNDCYWGHSLIPDFSDEENFFKSFAEAEEFYLDYGLAVDKFLKKFVNRQKGCKDGRFFPDFKYSFDFERKNELAEGWWPVLIQYRFDNYGGNKELQYYNKKHKAYLAQDQCD
jgi:hypothetical protein